ncbi:MAG: TolC family protein [Planctomycetota bacterium]|nr:MAG: TolC family protein [Planctomycetota bacterium]REK21581.1 MAG: TolC family protein [Planctomycetota bacterium]REK39866.1 MAG: TolC family protein [Planctomycetota bacterium]
MVARILLLLIASACLSAEGYAQPRPFPVSQEDHDPEEGRLDSEVAPPGRVGRAFVEPPPVPDLTTPEWAASPLAASTVEQPYTLDVLLHLAGRNNPTLREARLHINGQLARAQQAGLYPNPTLAYVGEQIGLNDTAGEWQGAELQQRFVTAHKLELSRNKYLQRAKVAEHLAVAQQFRVCNDVRIHFARALAALQIVELCRELLKSAEDHVLTVREMYNLGQTNRADAHQANAMLQRRRLEVLAAENEARQRLLELTAMVGLDAFNISLEGSLESERSVIEFESAYAQLLASSPELLAAYAKLREDSMTLARENVEWVPDIVVSAGPGYNVVDRQTTVAARVSVEIPLFDRNQGTINQAEADYGRQRCEIRRTELDLRRRLAEEYGRYLTAYQHAAEYEAVVIPSKREAYLVTLESYARNRAEWPDVLAAQVEYTDARMQYIEHQRDRRISEVLIDGFLLHGGLEAPPGPLPQGHIDSVPKPR